MEVRERICRVTEVTNDLERFCLLGVLFLRGVNGFPAPGIEAPDSWKWVDLPYEALEPDSDTLSAVMCEIKLLVRRAYVRLTYAWIGEGVCALRVYLLEQQSARSVDIRWFRDRFCRYKKSASAIDKLCLLNLRKLYTILDFSMDARQIDTSEKFVEYAGTHKVALWNYDKGSTDLGIPFDESDKQSFNFHIGRFINKQSYDLYLKSDNEDKPSLKTRLLNVYSQFKSPSVDTRILNDDQLELFTTVMNGEIPGFKSTLYNYQRRSVAKMFEKESVPCRQLMPYIITDGNIHVDLRTLEPVRSPEYFKAPRGGILAENMGLGKTCICLSLICLTKFQISENPHNINKGKSSARKPGVERLVDICSQFINQNSIPWKQYYDYFPAHLIDKLESHVGYFDEHQVLLNQYPSRRKVNELALSKRFYLTSATLVVIPDNLFHQWNLEVAKHTQKNFLKIFEISHVKSPIPELSQLVKYDAVFISMSAFSRQSQNNESPLRKIYWKRLIIDEGHSMNSKSTQAVSFARDLRYERMWAISGTPTSGMTNLHMEDENQEYNVRMNFDAKQDLNKLGSVISNFMKIEPWFSNGKLWQESIVKPMISNQFGIDYQLRDLLTSIIIRHNIDDVESDIKLPTLHHNPVFIKPSFFDQLSINLFISVLATNAVTSERNDVDYMFHPSNKSDLRRLVTNLRKATFYWTGFSINDVQNLLNICVYALNNNKYSAGDTKLLKRSVLISKLALANMRWRSTTTIHEMGYFISELPSCISKNYSLVHYTSDIYLYGFPQIIDIQRLYYKNRLVKTIEDLDEKVKESSSEFWSKYWKSITNNKSQASKRPVSNHEEFDSFSPNDVQIIGETPSWTDGFDPSLEEDLLYGLSHSKKRSLDDMNRNAERKESRKRRSIVKLDEPIGSQMRSSKIIGTSSAKLTYLTMKLLSNQKSSIKSIVFYEFENSAYYLTEFMDVIGMNYIMYSPYIKPLNRAKNLAQFDSWDASNGNGVALIMDLKLASHGLTIIAATHVFFINPVWNKTWEAQAIKRSHRIGQMNEVFVETLILEDTIEEQMYLNRGAQQAAEVELIDNDLMKQYILQFPFLRMFGDDFCGEYSPMEAPIGGDDRLGDESSDDELDGDMLRMKSVQSEVTDSVRKWRVPLFTEMNMTKLNQQTSKFKSDFDLDKNLEDVQIGTDSKVKTLELLQRIIQDKKNKKKMHNVRFDV